MNCVMRTEKSKSKNDMLRLAMYSIMKNNLDKIFYNSNRVMYY